MKDLIKTLDSFSRGDRFKYLEYAKVSTPSTPEDFYLLHLEMLYLKLDLIETTLFEGLTNTAIERKLKLFNDAESKRISKSFEQVLPKKSKKTDFNYEESFEASLMLLDRIEQSLFEKTEIRANWKEDFQSEILLNQRFLKLISIEQRTSILNETLLTKKYYRFLSKILGKMTDENISLEVVDFLTNEEDILKRAKICPFLKAQNINSEEIQDMLDKAVEDNNLPKILNLKRILKDFHFTGASSNSSLHHLWNKSNKTLSFEDELAILEAEENGTLVEFLKSNPRLLTLLVIFEVPFLKDELSKTSPLYALAVDYFFDNFNKEEVFKVNISDYYYKETLKEFFEFKDLLPELSVIQSRIGFNYNTIEQFEFVLNVNRLVEELFEIEGYHYISILHKYIPDSLSKESLEKALLIRKTKRSYKYQELTLSTFLEELFSLDPINRYAFLEAQYKKGEKNQINRFMNFFYHLNKSKFLEERDLKIPVSVARTYEEYREFTLNQNLLMQGLVDTLGYVSNNNPKHIEGVANYFFSMYGKYIINNEYTRRIFEETSSIFDYLSEDNIQEFKETGVYPLSEK